MRLTDYIATAQTNLLRTKVRTFLTVLAFVIGTFTLAMVTAFSQGLRSYVNTQLGAYGQPNVVTVGLASTKNQSSTSGVPYYVPNHQAAGGGGRDQKVIYTLNQSDLNKVKAAPYVKAAYPDFSNLSIDYIQYANSQKYVFGVQSAFPDTTTSLSAGQLPAANQPNGVVLPYPYVEALGFNSPSEALGKPVTLHISNADQQGKDFSAIVTGVLPDTAHTPSAYLSYQMIDSMVLYQTGNNNHFTDIVAITNNNPTKAIRADIKNNLQAQGYDVQTYDDILSNFSRPLNVITYGLDGFAAISLLAATIGIVNTLLMAVLERTQEIGLLKALGMRKRGITYIYLVEAASIGFWGGIIGVVLAYLLGLAANPLLTHSVFKGIGSAHILTYPLPYMAAIVVGAMIIGLLAGTLPAIRAGKLNPIDALRRE